MSDTSLRTSRRTHLFGNLFCWLVVLMLGALCAGCGNRSAAPVAGGIPIRQGFSLAKSGNTTTIDFWLREEEADLSRRFMLAVEFPVAHQATIEFVRKASPAIRAQVWKVDGDVLSPMNVLDMSGMYAAYGKSRLWHPSTSRPVQSLLHLQPDGNDGSIEYVVAGGFYAEGYGHYRARVETAFDLPVFEGVHAELVIDQFYNTGK